MATITDKLNQLESDRQDLVDNLETMGISGLSGDETFTELVPEVLNIPSGADLSDYFLTTLSNGDAYHSGFANIIKKIPSNITVSGTDLSFAFSYFNGTTIPSIDTSNVTNMSYMFDHCSNLTTVPELNTSNVTSMSYMFNYCSNLTTAPELNTSNVTAMDSCFEQCMSLTSAPNFDTSNVTTIRNCFTWCVSLRNVPIYDWSSISDNYGLYAIFTYCNSLTNESLDNILQSCISATSYNGTKTLARLGLTSYSSSTIEALPHYQDFINAGWTIN